MRDPKILSQETKINDVMEEYSHHFHTNKDDALSNNTLKSHTYNEKAISKLVRGKSVAIVGPAKPFEKNGSVIDSNDIIIRFNYLDPGMIYEKKEYIGSRTDISYYNISFEREKRYEIINTLKNYPIKLVILRRSLSQKLMHNMRKLQKLMVLIMNL